ncbi:hypothetical protein [Methylobacterium haplocladii]|uniref:Uncharacterized protein n=1 Tax=Methylobacterium haplocladii TaxID=1176176 RepID=A0A512IS42_9HYPH|nr:hypothetical protein [Methylobacterium haplocladii]GEP00530.1 hypothetical protein MHA02_29170 [Methylobacterium haplocladii]GJD85445.1 hypothetical protein HPGCJGGD_3334 [Methylobacterium haplocladii]GLS57830.1 hypothetical protein GCM10007887_04860 [Methylobacterium haplocladii]
MTGFLKRWFSWLLVPTASAAELDENGPLPNGIYLVPPHVTLSGYQPLSFYLAMRVGDADRVILRGATA